MTEHIHEQISAFIDDELSSEESAFLVRRLTSDKFARQQTIRYAAIGSVLRADAVLANSTLLRDRIHSALDGAPPAAARRQARTAQPRRWLQVLSGAGIAAAVAMIALVGLRTINQGESIDTPVQSVSTQPNGWAEPASYVVPGDLPASGRVIAPPIRLTNYLVQHGNYASTLHRTSVNSNVVGIYQTEAAEARFSEATR